MKAPEKLYVDTDDRLSDSILYGFTEKRKEDDIEYVRTDAFMEKATIWLNNCFITHDEYGVISTQFDTEEEMFEDFKNYIKGE